ncbi:glycerate kinase [Gaoshiqia sp. Z1-71]|uniref:glycerate kinase n=1 Tax=Gaoshiqia hydrogeniformans TaxID=3290090 RepID=UPI003BF9146C
MYPGPTSKIRVIVAPNSMKGSLSAIRFADLIGQAFHAVSDRFEVIKIPVADGGDDTAGVLMQTLQLKEISVPVHDPLGRIIQAKYGYANKTALIEMAGASGLKLLSRNELNPLETSSRGTGELLLDALKRGAKHILMGVGGSATIDGGMGLLEGLGLSFTDKNGQKLRASGANLGLIDSWNDEALQAFRNVDLKVMCDVNNPLLGHRGAVAIFGAQKGATPEMMPVLEKNLMYFAGLIRERYGFELDNIPGMGAAGGVNLALCVFLNARLLSGADFVLDALDFDEALKNSRLVVTGEGRIDSQTAGNKAPFAVAKRARQRHVPILAIGGEITPEGASLFDFSYSLVNDRVDQLTAIEQADRLVYERAKQAAQDFLDRPD